MAEQDVKRPPKHQVILKLFEECRRKGTLQFNNDDVKRVSGEKFKNQFDATKFDTRDSLPEELVRKGYCVVHLGRGNHCFLKAVNLWYHNFEDIKDPEDIVPWRYRKSLLNDIERGEASTLSFALNQRILHDFIYEDVAASPKVYLPGRTKASLSYRVGKTRITAEGQQIEIDLTLEYQGMVTVVEAKSKFIPNFAVYQIFHPIKYYLNKANQAKIKIDHINACYVLKQASSGRKKSDSETRVRMYLYEFKNPDRLDSIRLVRKAEYRLSQR